MPFLYIICRIKVNSILTDSQHWNSVIIFIVVAKEYTVYPEKFAVIKFGDLPEIWQKCIFGTI